MAHIVSTLPDTTKAQAVIGGFVVVVAALALVMRALVGA